MKIAKFKKHVAAILLIFGGLAMHAQDKFNATYEAQSEVVVELQASHTNIIVEPWNRDEVKVEAYLEDNSLTQEENLQILESWNLETRASQSRISIGSRGGSGLVSHFNFPQGPVRPREMSERMNSMLNLFSQHSDSVNAFRNLRQMQFDFEAYNKDGESYLEQWERQVKEKLGDNTQVAVQSWSSSSPDTLQHEEMQKHMAAVNQRLEEARAQFEDRYGLMMQQMSERFMGQMQGHPGQFFNGKAPGKSTSNVEKTIMLRMPKNARLVLRVRHGTVSLKGELINMRGSVTYAPFTAEKLSGENTLLQVSYAPVKIDVWNYGELQASYTPSFEIGTVRSLQLTSNSGDLKIGKILDMALISGTFGTIEVAELGKDFSLLNLSLNNSDLFLHVPNTGFDFAYNGSRSEISYPEVFKAQRKQNYDTEFINGHHKSANAQARINIRAQYSKVDLKL